MKKFIVVALLLVVGTFAHAGLTETTFNRYNQNSPMGATQLFNPASSFTGNYLISIYLSANADACWMDMGNPEGAVVVTISWTDEMGTQQQGVQSSPSCGLTDPPPATLVFPIHPLASTPVYVTTTMHSTGLGPSPLYNLSVDAIGFW